MGAGALLSAPVLKEDGGDVADALCGDATLEMDPAWGSGALPCAGGVTGRLELPDVGSVGRFESSVACVTPKLRESLRLRSAEEGWKE